MEREYLDKLKSAKLFQNVDENVITNVLKSGDIMSYKKGENICDYLKDKKAVGIVLKGKIEIKNKSDNNGIVLNVKKENETFGTWNVFNGDKKMGFETKAATNTSVFFIEEAGLKDLFIESPSAMNNYLEICTGSIHFLAKKIEGFTAGSAEEKLAVYIKENMDDTLDTPVVIVDGSISKLASTLDLGRASLYRALDTLENNYVIMRNRKQIRVIDKEKLDRLCK